MKPPELPSFFEPAHISLPLADGFEIKETLLENLELSSVSCRNLSVQQSVLRETDLSSSKLRDLVVIDAEFTRVLTFGSDWDGVLLRRVRAEGGVWSGLVLSGATLNHVTFKDVKLNLANFRLAKLNHVRFENCLLAEADFSGAELSKVVFEGCDMTKAEFHGIKVSNVLFDGSNLSDVRGATSLRGAVVDPVQLIPLGRALAAEAGIKVKEEEINKP